MNGTGTGLARGRIYTLETGRHDNELALAFRLVDYFQAMNDTRL